VPQAPFISPTTSARVIHAALVLGIAVFWFLAWYVGTSELLPVSSLPVSALPDRKVLYVALFLVSGTLFGAAGYTAWRLVPSAVGMSEDEWWRANLGRVIVVWALVEAPAILGTVAYLLTRDFRTLLAPFTGLLFFVNYRPSRFTER
jgi:hypothetical protein